MRSYQEQYRNKSEPLCTKLTIGSDGRLSGVVNNKMGWAYYAVPLIYDQFRTKGKTGLTKVNFDHQKARVLVNIQEKIYWIIYGSPLTLSRKTMPYEIEVI